jgi:hypothetical protein
MKTWNDIKLNDHIYLLKWHKIGYVEIRRCKVIDVKYLTNEYIKIWYTHPLNKDLDFLKSENHEFLLIKDMSVSENDWQIKKRKYLLITEFNENIIKEFETIHGI